MSQPVGGSVVLSILKWLIRWVLRLRPTPATRRPSPPLGDDPLLAAEREGLAALDALRTRWQALEKRLSPILTGRLADWRPGSACPQALDTQATLDDLRAQLAELRADLRALQTQWARPDSHDRPGGRP